MPYIKLKCKKCGYEVNSHVERCEEPDSDDSDFFCDGELGMSTNYGHILINHGQINEIIEMLERDLEKEFADDRTPLSYYIAILKELKK